MPVSVTGLYVADSVLGPDNTLLVDVNVTGIGNYQIYTDTLNGYYFSGTGTFDTTGVHQVKLSGTGKPLMPGANEMNIHFNRSTCTILIPVIPNALPPATFTLAGTPGKCVNTKVLGTYVKTKLLDTANKVEITVNVLTAGRYNIKTQLVNGYSFSAGGVFTTTGLQTISLTGIGWPENAGVDKFILNSASSACNFDITVMSDDAVFTLHTSAGQCMNYTVTGTFVKDLLLDTMSRAVISVDVTTPGRYTLNTLLVNGYSFKAAGVFSSSGTQQVTLIADGKPLKSGTDEFTVSAGTTTCTFSVVVLADIVRTSGTDYLPLADSNSWVYDDLFYKGNVITRVINGAEDRNGKLYFNMNQFDMFGVKDSFFVRRNGDDYIEFARRDKYTTSFSYLVNNPGELMFLKELLQQDQNWESPEFRDVSTFNQSITLKYGYKVKQTNAVIAVNGQAFANVVVIEQRSQLHADSNPWGATNDVYTYYYARGIGLIYLKRISNNFTAIEMGIKNWKVK